VGEQQQPPVEQATANPGETRDGDRGQGEQPPVEDATADPGSQRVTPRGLVPGLPEQQGPTTPQPNRADDAFDELRRLQDEARGLGLEVTGREPLGELRRQVREAQAR
jgi:hypothetical protein